MKEFLLKHDVTRTSVRFGFREIKKQSLKISLLKLCELKPFFLVRVLSSLIVQEIRAKSKYCFFQRKIPS
jgi:hypothetical protein